MASIVAGCNKRAWRYVHMHDDDCPCCVVNDLAGLLVHIAPCDYEITTTTVNNAAAFCRLASSSSSSSSSSSFAAHK